MKRMLIVVCVCVLGVGLVGGMAQEKRKETNESLIEKKYDRFKDETTIKLKPQKIREIAKPREELSLSVEATHKGERAARPKEAILVFNSISEKYIYFRKSEVTFIVDGKRIEAGTALEMGGTPGFNVVNTTLKLTIPLDVFLSLANGKEVEVKLGRVEHRLLGEVVSSLRTFANAITGESNGG